MSEQIETPVIEEAPAPPPPKFRKIPGFDLMGSTLERASSDNVPAARRYLRRYLEQYGPGPTTEEGQAIVAHAEREFKQYIRGHRDQNLPRSDKQMKRELDRHTRKSKSKVTAAPAKKKEKKDGKKKK